MHLPRLIRHLGGLVAMLALVAVGFVAVPGTADAAPTAISLTSSSCSRTVVKGDKDGCVTRLQQILKQNGHDLEVDGSFGEATFAKVKAFQKAKGLEQDGRVGTKTKAAVEQWHIPSNLSNSQCSATMRRGDIGGCVVRLQHQLTAAGHKTGADGRFFDATEAAVMAFQKAKA